MRREIFPAVNSIAVPDGGRRKSQYDHRVSASLCILLCLTATYNLLPFAKTKGVTMKAANKLRPSCYKSKFVSADLTFHYALAPNATSVTCKILCFSLNMPTFITASGRELETCTREQQIRNGRAYISLH